MKNNDLNRDKYGFWILSSARGTENSHLYVNLYYENLEKHEDFTLTFDLKKGYNLANRAKERFILRTYNNKSIVTAIADAIKHNYGTYIQKYPAIDELINEIPTSIILNEEAIKELLSNLKHNQNLFVYVANEIKRRKTELKEKGDAKKLEEELNNEKFNQLKEEFGL